MTVRLDSVGETATDQLQEAHRLQVRAQDQGLYVHDGALDWFVDSANHEGSPAIAPGTYVEIAFTTNVVSASNTREHRVPQRRIAVLSYFLPAHNRDCGQPPSLLQGRQRRRHPRRGPRGRRIADPRLRRHADPGRGRRDLRWKRAATCVPSRATGKCGRLHPADIQITDGPDDKTKKKQATFTFASTEPGRAFSALSTENRNSSPAARR